VAWFTDRQLFLLAVLVYGLSTVYSVFLWRKGFRKDDHANYLLLLAAFVLQTTAMTERAVAYHRCPVKGIVEATMFLGWALATVYLLIGLLPRLRFLGAFASPGLLAIGVFVVLFWNGPVLAPHPELVSQEFSSQLKMLHWLMSLHAALALLAYGAFGLSSVAALMYLTQERNLKFHKLQAVRSLMPPIQRLEATTARLLLGGFILLTIGLAIGVYVLVHLKNSYSYLNNPEIGLSVAVWLFYLSLAIMRWMTMNWRFLGGFILLWIGVSGLVEEFELAWPGFWQESVYLVICLCWMGLGLMRLHWRFALSGRRFALGAICSFVFVLLTFWVILLSPLHHP